MSAPAAVLERFRPYGLPVPMPEKSQTPTRLPPRVLCVLSEEQSAEYEEDFGAMRRPGVEWMSETSADDALDRVEPFRPGVVIVGMTLGPTEGLEFVALLFRRYRDFGGKVIVLPNKDDPFPPMLQQRDPSTGRSSTVQTDLAGVKELVGSLAPPQPEEAPPSAGAESPAVAGARVLAGVVEEQRAVRAVGGGRAPTATAAVAPKAALPEQAAPPPSPEPDIARGLATATPLEPSDPNGAMIPAAAPAAVVLQPATQRSARRAKWPIVAGLGAVMAVGAAAAAAVLLLPASTARPAGAPRADSTSAESEAAPAPPKPSAEVRASSTGTAQSARGASGKRKGPEATKSHFGELVTLPLSYARGSADYHISDRGELDGVVAELTSAMTSEPSARLEVGGHTSGEGATDINLRLGYRRASKVVTYLVSRGIDAERIVMKSYGTTMPLVSGSSQEQQDGNRRVTIRLVE